MRTFPKSTEQIQDIVAALLQAGTGISIVYNDAGNALTISASGGGGGSLTVREVDGTPTGTVDTIVFPNSTVAIVDNVATITGLQGQQGIQGIQGIQGNPGPAGPNLINASTSTTLNGFLTGNGSTVVVTQYGTTAGTVCQGNDARLSDARTPLAHPHGNITNAGAIGSTANLPLITGAGGVVTTGSFGTTANTFCQGNDARLSDARTPLAHNQAWSTITSTPTTLSGYGITDAATATHSHGNITNAGAIGSTSGLVVMTGAGGVLTTGQIGIANISATGTPNSTTYLRGDGAWVAVSGGGGGDALTTGPLSQFAATTSAQLAGVMSDETGTGALVFATSPTLVSPILGTPTSGTLTNCTGYAYGNLTGVPSTFTPSAHTHGNITNAGAIGSTANLPLITTTGGVVTTGTFGSAANTFCQGNDVRLSDARTPLSHQHGNISNTGAIGTTANLPVITGASGVLTTGTASGTGSFVFSSSPAIITPTITFSTTPTLTAGTNAQGQGAITADNVVIGTAANNPSGATLPTATVGRIVHVTNRATNPVNVYPAVGASIDGLAANTPVLLPVGGYINFRAASTTAWHSSLGATVAIGSTANLPLITGTGGVVTTGTFGTTANTFCQGNDARLSDARTPLAHNQAWSTITSTPTTLAGYGITDAQPSNGGLTSLASASATNAIYYRSAADTWSVVTIGANLSFTAGTLAATGGGSTTDASLLTTGTLADARLSSNIPRLNASNTFSVDQTFSGQVTVGSNLFGASIWVMNSNSLTLNSGSNNTYIQQSGNTLFVSNYGGANAVTRWYQNANEVMQLRNDLSAEFFGNVTVQGWLDARLRPFTVAGLPLASANARRELWVTDSTLAMLPANYGTTVTGGGSNGARVISNGTNWIIA